MRTSRALLLATLACGGAFGTALLVGARPAAPQAPTAVDPTSGLPYTPDAEMLLSREKRLLIWNEEDRYHQLMTKVMNHWDADTKAGRTDAYRASLAPEFRARWAAAVAPPAWEPHGALEWAFGTAQGPEEAPAGAESILAALDALRREYATTRTAHWAITSWAPVEGDGGPGTSWEGRVQLEIRGTTPEGRRAETLLKCRLRTGPMPADLAGLAGWLREADVLSIRRVRVTEATGPLLPSTTPTLGPLTSVLHDNWTSPRWLQVSGGVILDDLDGDGPLDLLVTDVNRVAFLHGLGDGTFEDRTMAVGLPTTLGRAPTPALCADLDGDARPDLVLGDRLFRGTEVGTFEFVRGRRLTLPEGVTNLSAADYDGDGRIDLYVCTTEGRGHVARASWLGDREHQPNLLLRNEGGFVFRDVTEATGTGDRGASFAAVWFDHDGNRFPDLFVVNEVGQNSLYLNDGTIPLRRVDPDGARWGGFSMGVEAADTDGDGRTDVFVADMYSKAGSRIIGLLVPTDYPPGVLDKIRDFVTGNRLHVRGDGRGGFSEIGPEAGCASAGWAYGVRAVDLDGDGWLDLTATCGQKSVTRDEPDG